MRNILLYIIYTFATTYSSQVWFDLVISDSPAPLWGWTPIDPAGQLPKMATVAQVTFRGVGTTGEKGEPWETLGDSTNYILNL